MKHDNERVRSFLVSQIDCLTDQEDDIQFLFSNNNLIEVVVLSLKDEDIDVFKTTQNLLKKISNSLSGLKLIFSNENLSKAFKSKTKN